MSRCGFKTWENSTKAVPFIITFHRKFTFLTETIKVLSKYLHINLKINFYTCTYGIFLQC